MKLIIDIGPTSIIHAGKLKALILASSRHYDDLAQFEAFFNPDTTLVALENAKGVFEQAICAHMPDDGLVSARYFIGNQASNSPSTELFNALCASCSGKYIDLSNEKALISIQHIFYDRASDVLAAIEKSKLNDYVIEAQHNEYGAGGMLRQTIDYWKYAK